MITIGVDFHKQTSSYHVLDENGKFLKRCKLKNNEENIRKFIQSFQGPKQVAMEATRNWGIFFECIKDLVDDFQLGHPKKMKAITDSETKNDKHDAQMIAKLTYSKFLPKAHVSHLDNRQLRSLLRYRHFLVKQRRAIRQQVQTLIDRNLWPCDRPKAFKDIFCKKGIQWLKSITLHERERFILDQALESFEDLSRRILQIEDYVNQQTAELKGLEYLRTTPGFKTSRVNAYIVLLETDDIHRFRKANGFAHYAGLVPREHSSGSKQRHGRLVKNANMHLRTAFIESTLAAIRLDKGLKSYYKKVKKSSGSGSAIIACARKLSYAVYHVLKDQRPYRAEPPVAA